METVQAEFTSGFVCKCMDETQRKVQVLLEYGDVDLATRQITKIDHRAKYLRAHFNAAALARGPIQ
jgi:hypothetical protein